MSYTQNNASYTQNFVDACRNAVKLLVDKGGTAQIAPQVYDVLIKNLWSQNGATPLLNNLLQVTDQLTRGVWRTQGVDPHQLTELLRPWTKATLDSIGNQIAAAQQTQYPQQQFGGQQMQPGYGFQSNAMSPTNTMYAGASGPAPVYTAAAAPVVDIPVADVAISSTFQPQGSPVMFEIHRASNAEFQQPSNGILKISEFFNGEYENTRMMTSEITVRVPQNNAIDVAKLVFRNSPQEVIRGTFANVVYYRELFHLTMSYTNFATVADAVWDEFSKENNWRAGIRVLNSRTKGEWEVMNRALSRLLDDMIYRRLRTSVVGISILGIDGLDDLMALDDRNSDYKTMRHKEYWSTFNNIVNTCMAELFNPENRVGPDDANFGDFIHCNAVDYYANEHSKYDYGTFKEAIDRKAFIDQMLTTSTVIRISRAAIFTNALDPRLVALIKKGKPADQILLHTINTAGTTLLGKVEYLKRGDVETIICMQQQNGTQTYDQIRVGRTLDHDIALLA